MEFLLVEVLKDAIREYAIKNSLAIRYIKNDKLKVRVACAEGCPFLLYARAMADKVTFKVKTLNANHDCALVFNNPRLDSTWLSKKYINKFRYDTNLSKSTFVELVQDDCMSSVSNMQFYRARKKTLNVIRGSIEEQYQLLEDHCDQLLRSNVGSPVKLKTKLRKKARVFESIYICLAACREGFKAG